MLFRELKRHFKHQGGFTLVDAVLGWVVIGVIALTLAYLLQMAVDSFSMIASRKEALAATRYAADRMTRELLLIKSSDLLALSQTQIQFLDHTGAATDFHSAVVNGKIKLYRGVNLLADDLQSFTVKYFDASGIEITDYNNLAGVRRILLDLGVTSDNNYGTVSVRGEVYPRNFLYTNYQ